LDALIRAHLPPVAASLLAQPSPSADGTAVEWYSDLAGQPIPLGDVPLRNGMRFAAAPTGFVRWPSWRRAWSSSMPVPARRRSAARPPLSESAVIRLADGR
jgi:hypothetical protein